MLKFPNKIERKKVENQTYASQAEMLLALFLFFFLHQLATLAQLASPPAWPKWPILAPWPCWRKYKKKTPQCRMVESNPDHHKPKTHYLALFDLRH